MNRFRRFRLGLWSSALHIRAGVRLRIVFRQRSLLPSRERLASRLRGLGKSEIMAALPAYACRA